MLAKDVSLGSTITSVEGGVPDPGVVIFKKYNGEIIIGWKIMPPSFTAWNLNQSSYPVKYNDGYRFGWRISGNTNIELVCATTDTPAHIGGMNCAIPACNTYNEYAAPNQSDGKTYMCYSCRVSGRKVI